MLSLSRWVLAFGIAAASCLSGMHSSAAAQNEIHPCAAMDNASPAIAQSCLPTNIDRADENKDPESDNAPIVQSDAEAELDAIFNTFEPAVPFPNQDETFTVCGVEDNSVDVESFNASSPGQSVTPEWVANHEPTTVRLKWIHPAEFRRKFSGSMGTVGNKGWCTGTLISPTLVLTAAHCFEPKDGSTITTPDGRQKRMHLTPFKRVNGGRIFYGPEQIAEDLLQVNFGYQNDRNGSLRDDVMSVDIVELIEKGRGEKGEGLDYAIIRIEAFDAEKHPRAYPSPATIEFSAPEPSATIGIIQHPNGQPKRIESGSLLRASNNKSYLFYVDVDTDGAASGSAVRDENGAVLGVHIVGHCNPASASMTADRPDKDIIRNANIGLSIDRIVRKSSTLKAMRRRN